MGRSTSVSRRELQFLLVPMQLCLGIQIFSSFVWKGIPDRGTNVGLNEQSGLWRHAEQSFSITVR